MAQKPKAVECVVVSKAFVGGTLRLPGQTYTHRGAGPIPKWLKAKPMAVTPVVKQKPAVAEAKPKVVAGKK